MVRNEGEPSAEELLRRFRENNKRQKEYNQKPEVIERRKAYQDEMKKARAMLKDIKTGKKKLVNA